MDELIILLVRGIIKLLGGDTTRKPPAMGGPPQWVPPSPSVPQAANRAVGRAPVRSGTRRPGGRRPPLIPVAAPIITSTSGNTSEFPTTNSTVKATITGKPRTATHPVSVNAVAIKKWLSPTVLQKQFILTEIFQSPLAMRNKP